MTNEEIAAELEALNENATLGRDGTNWGYLIAEQALKEFYRNHHAAIVSALRRGAVAKLQISDHIALPDVATKITAAGGSIRDVQQLAGHRSLVVTQRYIEGNSDAKRRVVGMV